mgnify:CR=1 FL=1|jgi:hypothetical protein
MTSPVDSAYGIAFAILFVAIIYLLFKKFVKGGGIKYDRYKEHRDGEYKNDAKPTEQRDNSNEVGENIIRQPSISKAPVESTIGKHDGSTRPKRKRRLVIRKS